jgi:hypothetical protein
MSKPAYFIVKEIVNVYDRIIDTAKLAESVNNKIEEGYVVSGGITFGSKPTDNGSIILFQPMILIPTQQNGGNGTKRRRSRKNV